MMHQIDLKSCPNPACDGEDDLELVRVFSRGPGYYTVRCRHCVTCGPGGDLEEEASRRWNLLPRKSDLADAWDAGAEQAIDDTHEARHYAPTEHTYSKNPHRNPKAT
jgi:hypothetical protein